MTAIYVAAGVGAVAGIAGGIAAFTARDQANQPQQQIDIGSREDWPTAKADGPVHGFSTELHMDGSTLVGKVKGVDFTVPNWTFGDVDRVLVSTYDLSGGSNGTPKIRQAYRDTTDGDRAKFNRAAWTAGIATAGGAAALTAVGLLMRLHPGAARIGTPLAVAGVAALVVPALLGGVAVLMNGVAGIADQVR